MTTAAVTPPPVMDLAPPRELLSVALSVDSLTPVYVIDDRFRFRFLNTFAQDRLRRLGLDPATVTMLEVNPPHVTAERRILIAHSFETGTPVTVDGMVDGVMLRCTHRPFTTDTGERRILITSAPLRRSEPPPPAPGTVHVAAHAHDLGDLTRLTEREIEVLCLIGKGMSNEQVAAALHRSVKTVQGHRLSLGVKLATGNRVEVATVAINAGLADMSVEEAARIWRSVNRPGRVARDRG